MVVDWSRYMPGKGRPDDEDLHLEIFGFEAVREQLRSMVEGHAEDAVLALISGSVGSGKSTILKWLRAEIGPRYVDIREIVEGLRPPRLAADGRDLPRLTNQILEAVALSDADPVLGYDDIDHDLRDAGIAIFLQQSLAQANGVAAVLTMSTPLATDRLPSLASKIALDRRRADPAEIEAYIDRVVAASEVVEDPFTRPLRQALVLLSEHCTDFRAFQQVCGALINYSRGEHRPASVDDLSALIDSDQSLRHRLPRGYATHDNSMGFRRKDKAELLAELLRRNVNGPEDLITVGQKLQGFGPEEFLVDAERDFDNALLTLAVTTSPRDLVKALLSEPLITREIDALNLDPQENFDGKEEKANLLVRGLGFTVTDSPEGLGTLRALVNQDFNETVRLDANRQDLHLACSHTIGILEVALADLLHFWSLFLFDSLKQAVNTFNGNRPQSKPLVLQRLNLGDMVSLLRFLQAHARRSEETRLRLRTLGIEEIFSDGALAASNDFVELRNRYIHGRAAVLQGPSPASARAIGEARRLIQSAATVLARLDNESYPTVVKLAEIVIDEYSRRIYRAVDADHRQVTFALTDDRAAAQLGVSTHYYLLPARRVTVNPYVVSRSGSPTPVLFDEAEEYARHSDTQRRQADKLMRLITQESPHRILDVGCGTGELAIKLARKYPNSHIVGIDSSPEMIGHATELLGGDEVAGVEFIDTDLLDYEPDMLFDLVVSSSTMHWILPSNESYGRLFSLLQSGGSLVVHQGGDDTYRGLRATANEVIDELDLRLRFPAGRWYPAFYPTELQMREVLKNAGFVDILIDSQVTDGTEFPNLVHDFSRAGLLPYLRKLPENMRDSFRMAFLDTAEFSPPDLYTHRLYISARRP